MIKILIIEDEAIAARNLQRMLSELTQAIEVVAVIDSQQEAIEQIPLLHFDLMLMDIHLTDGNAFGIFEKINCPKPIIFTTAFDQYTLKAFKQWSIDYLLKPIIKSDLQLAIDKYEKHFSSQTPNLPYQELIHLIQGNKQAYKTRYLVQIGNKLNSISVEDIAYFNSTLKISYLTLLEKKTYPIEYSLLQLEKELNPEQFFRVNRQLLVSRKAIKNIFYVSPSKIRIDLSPPFESPVVLSSEKIADFKQWLM